MQKLNLIIGVLFIISTTAFSQKTREIKVQESTKEVGMNLLEQSPITATEYILPDRIHSFHVDTINSFLTLKLRGLRNGKWLRNNGSVLQFDSKYKKVAWSKSLYFNVEDIEHYAGVTIHSTSGKSFLLDNESGSRLWEIKNSIIFADPIDKLGIGYKVKTGIESRNVLEGINLLDGSIIWQRLIRRDYGWNDVIYLNDTTLLIAAAGLHTVNIQNGKGWDYHAVTGKKDYTGSVVGTGLGIAAGLLTGTYAVSTGHDLVRDIVSNVYVDSLYIYFASKDKIVKLDKAGNIIWKTPLPDDLTSKSVIMVKGNNLIMINKGYAFMGYRQLNIGTPFIASFNLNTGEKNYLNILSDKKKEMINGFDFTEDSILLVFNDRISKCSFNDGVVKLTKSFDTKETGQLENFIGDHVFIQKGSQFLSLPRTDSTKHFLITESGNTLVLNQQFEVLNEIPFKDLYINYLRKNNFNFISKGDQTLIINNSGEKVAELTSNVNAVLLNNKLYNKSNTKLLEIDLSSILSHN